MTLPSSQGLLAGTALLGLILLGGVMIFVPVPPANATLVATAIGALASTATIVGGQKLADKLTTSTGPNATIQPEASTPQPQKEP